MIVVDTVTAYMGFADRLKAELADRNLSQARFSTQLGISYDLINCYANGRRIPSYRNMLRMIEYLHGVDVSWFVTGQGEEEV